MIERLGSACAAVAERWVPSPFVLALLLTLVAFLLAIFGAGAAPAAALAGWAGGFWDLLGFAMQMSLILVTGHALAVCGPVRAGIARLAEIPRGARSAAALTAAVSVVLSLVHWGLGLVVGALLARELGRSLARRGVPHHYPLLVAAAYAGFLSWHGGLSGSAPLTVATPGHFLEGEVGVIGVERTLASPANLLLSALLLVFVPLFAAAMSPSRGGRPAPGSVLDGAPAHVPAGEGETGRLDRSRLLGTLFGVAGVVVVVAAFVRRGFSALDLNLVNFTFLFLGLLVHGSPSAYGRAVASGISGTAGIVVQFPFYAGILGLMKSTGLIEKLAHLGAGAGAAWFLPATFLSAAVVNQFVPSGGAQWAVQGPIAVRAAAELGVPPERAVLAIAWGDEWTNMLQPFWALAVLGVTRLAVREILGYTALMMFLTGPFYLIALLMA